MSCENPMIRVQIKVPQSEKPQTRLYNMRKFCKGGYKGEIDYKLNGLPAEEYDHHGTAYKYNVSEQIWIEAQLKNNRAQLIPCGKCAACMKNTSRQWAARIENEAENYTDKVFLTLTYDQENLPVLDINTGEIYRGYKDPVNAEVDKWNRTLKHPERGTLWPDDITKFIKRLRKNAETYNRAEKADENSLNIKYFYCGEYGSTYFRPHYHMILLGYIIPDATYWKESYDAESRKTEPIYKSEIINNLWGKGEVSVQTVEQGSIGYVCGYCQKKGKYYQMKNEEGELTATKYDEAFRKFGLYPEYRRMSQGIGKQWAIEHAETLNETSGGELANGHHMPKVRYYDQIIDNIMLAKEENQPMQEAKETTEEETEQAMKSQYMKGVKQKRRENAFATDENTRYNAYGKTGAKRLILEHIDIKAEQDRTNRKNQSTRKEKGQF